MTRRHTAETSTLDPASTILHFFRIAKLDLLPFSAIRVAVGSDHPDGPDSAEAGLAELVADSRLREHPPGWFTLTDATDPAPSDATIPGGARPSIADQTPDSDTARTDGARNPTADEPDAEISLRLCRFLRAGADIASAADPGPAQPTSAEARNSPDSPDFLTAADPDSFTAADSDASAEPRYATNPDGATAPDRSTGRRRSNGADGSDHLTGAHDSARPDGSVDPDPAHTPRAWVHRYHQLVPGALHAATAAGHAAVAADTAAAWWPIARLVPYDHWRAALAHEGEEAAITARNPGRLITLLDRSAHLAAAEGRWALAEQQWVRLTALAAKLDDTETDLSTVDKLGTVYHAWGRYHRAMDMYAALLPARRRAGDPAAVAPVLRDFGRTMLAAGRPDDAVGHLAEAARLVDPDTTPPTVTWSTTERADLLVLLGRAHWAAGHSVRAERAFSRALAALVDLDDDRAERVRALLRTAPGAALPEN